MRRLLAPVGIGLLVLTGCAYERAPATSRARVTTLPQARGESARPLPAPNPEDFAPPPPPFYDPPLVGQRLPEEQAFVNAYNAVGRPRMVVFVNRTLDGQLVPVNGVRPPQYVPAPGEYRAPGQTYLHSGQYDEAAARSLDYEAVEAILTDWLSADGRTQIVSPTIARQRLSDQQVRDLQGGRPVVVREIAQQLDAHILIQVQAHPTRQAQGGLQVRLVAEAVDLKHDGTSLGRAVVDMPLPLEKVQINNYTRFLARKLMDGMIGAWQSPPSGNAVAPAAAAPGQTSTDQPVWPLPAAPATVPAPATLQHPLPPPVTPPPAPVNPAPGA